MRVKYGIWHGSNTHNHFYWWYADYKLGDYTSHELNEAYRIAEDRQLQFPTLVYEVREYQ